MFPRKELIHSGTVWDLDVINQITYQGVPFVPGGAASDELVKVTAADTAAGYLGSKIVAGSGIQFTTNNPGANETLTIACNVVDLDVKVAVSATDTTAGFLNGKLVAGSNVTFTVGNAGGNETLTIAAAGGVTGFIGSQNTAAPNNSVNASRLLVDAATTNADAVIQPKGTGALLAQLPDGTVTGGNKRGTNAVDFQTVRTLNTHVANGTSAAILSGGQNRSSGFASVVAGGYSNTAQTQYSFIGGGTNNTASGDQATIGGGTGNSASNTNAGVFSGSSNSATNPFSCILGGSANVGNNAAYGAILGGSDNRMNESYAFVGGGAYADAHRYGGYAHSAGRFTVTGDCQYERCILRGITTNATPLVITLDNGASGSFKPIIIQSDSTYTFRALVTARRTDADNESACWQIMGGIDRNAAASTTALVGTPVTTTLGDDSAGAWLVSVTADTTNGALQFEVTGQTGKTIRWGATVELMKIQG